MLVPIILPLCVRTRGMEADRIDLMGIAYFLSVAKGSWLWCPALCAW
jgi:hypothetical protein